MRRYAVVRTLSILPTLFGVSVAIFLLIRLIPGTVVDQMIGTEGTYSVETERALRAFFGLDQPIHVQYLRWLGQIGHGDLGQSWRTGLPVREMIWSRFAVTSAADFAGVFPLSQQPVVQPVLHHRLAVAALALGQLVFMMRKHQVQAAAVDVESFAQ